MPKTYSGIGPNWPTVASSTVSFTENEYWITKSVLCQITSYAIDAAEAQWGNGEK